MRKTAHRSVYIAGPMTGLPDDNYPAFHEGAERWRKVGWEVKNPAEHFDGIHDLPRAVYLRAAIEDLLTVDGVALLPDWEASEGAKLEVRIGIELGLGFYAAESMAPIPAPYVGLFASDNTTRVLQRAVPHGDYHDELQEHILIPGTMTQTTSLPVGAQIDAILDDRGVGMNTAKPPTVLEEAAKLVENGGDRNDSYDHPYPNFSKIAKVWELILNTPVTPAQVALMMIGMKLVREAHKHKRDNIVDIVGYARCHERLEEWDAERDAVRADA